ncbi:DUF86 domain-containing protein [Candidatus Woesearchaeota archaeon]|nr:DUF86 domain-containing protein [Candidatus Woesearchaeota archaeon]
MKGRIKDKIEELEKYLDELSRIKPITFDENDLKTKAACERYLEKIIEAVVDLAFLIIKDEGLELPEDDNAAFEILSKAKIIDDILAKKLRDAKGMRNILAHQYGQVDDKIVFNATKEIETDVNEFIEQLWKIAKK